MGQTPQSHSPNIADSFDQIRLTLKMRGWIEEFKLVFC